MFLKTLEDMLLQLDFILTDLRLIHERTRLLGFPMDGPSTKPYVESLSLKLNKLNNKI